MAPWLEPLGNVPQMPVQVSAVQAKDCPESGVGRSRKFVVSTAMPVGTCVGASTTHKYCGTAIAGTRAKRNTVMAGVAPLRPIALSVVAYCCWLSVKYCVCASTPPGAWDAPPDCHVPVFPRSLAS